jgi:hypothetical protein
MIHGVVKDHCNKLIKDAIVKLFKMGNPTNPKALEPITHTFTDEHGQFMFGPLAPHVKYVIKVWINHVNTREIVINADDLDGHDDDCDDEDVDEMVAVAGGGEAEACVVVSCEDEEAYFRKTFHWHTGPHAQQKEERETRQLLPSSCSSSLPSSSSAAVCLACLPSSFFFCLGGKEALTRKRDG